ncbi:MAG: hypothetical protein J1F23_02305 [Oscillospiraceae bacterium]|nr:hypothetical protein [Oscillospiraceae bacterium]
MIVLKIDYDYYKFPQTISTVEAFISYVNEHYHTFIPLIQYQTVNCAFPYLIEEESKTVYVNVAGMEQIYTEEATVIPTRKEYDDRLKRIIQEKCKSCKHYEEDADGDDLSGHRDKLTLDGECWMYEKEII